VFSVLGFLALVLPSGAGAQGLPELAPINPMSSSRSGLYFQPFREPAPGRWVMAAALDYASIIEYNQRSGADFVLDSELLRMRLGLSRDLGSRTFLLVEGGIGGAYAGFMDGFLDWYHGTLGIRMSERESRPRDRFLYEIGLPDGRMVERSRSNIFLDDLRVGFGFRPHAQLQTVLSLTLPTSTGPVGYGRRVPSFNLLNTVAGPLSERVHYEGSIGLGYTPKNGSLAGFEHNAFAAVTSGLRITLWGRNSAFATLFYHSPYYESTDLPALDRRELSLDFGWAVQTRTHGEWRIGMTEDLEPGGPGVDLVFRVGRRF
jgi:hypothetical protein